MSGWATTMGKLLSLKMGNSGKYLSEGQSDAPPSDLYKIKVAKFVYIAIFIITLLHHFSDIFLKHVNTPFEQRDFPLMKTTYIFLVIKQVGCNVASNIKVSLFGILFPKKCKN